MPVQLSDGGDLILEKASSARACLLKKARLRRSGFQHQARVHHCAFTPFADTTSGMFRHDPVPRVQPLRTPRSASVATHGRPLRLSQAKRPPSAESCQDASPGFYGEEPSLLWSLGLGPFFASWGLALSGAPASKSEHCRESESSRPRSQSLAERLPPDPDRCLPLQEAGLQSCEPWAE